MAIAGRVAIVPKGDWSADATYKRLDAVTYNNTLYFAKKDVPAGTVTSNTEYWSKSIVGGAGGVATADEAGVVKPADGLTVAEDGTLKVSIDGTTLTMDQVNNVIKLADTLKEKINGAFPAANVANNQVTTEAGFALDARQANPNIDGSLAKQISDLNGSMLLFSIGVIRDESIEKAILSFIQQHKGQNVEASFILDGVTIPNDIPDRTVEWMYCSGKYIGRNSFDDVYDGHIILFGYNSNRIACKPISNGDSVSSWGIK